MTEIGYWLIGIILAMFGIGQGMLFQGKILLGEDKERIGKKLKGFGWFWIGIAGIYLAIYIIFWELIPRIFPQ